MGVRDQRGTLNDQPIAPSEGNVPTVNDQYWSLGVRDQRGTAVDQPITPSEGHVPAWLKGQYILGGPSLFQMGKRKLNHLFDGFARMSSFRFNGSDTMLFSSRLMDSMWYNHSIKADDVAPQFLMNATTPPRLSDKVPMLNALAPNDNNIVFPLRMNATTWWYLSDSETRLEFDPSSLRITGELHASQPMHKGSYSGDAEPKGYMCTIGTAHSLFQPLTGDLISQMGCSPSNPLSKQPDLVVVYRMTPTDPTRRIPVAQFTPKSGHASYMHSFGLNNKHAVFVEQAIGFDMSAMMEGKSMIAGMPVDYTLPTYFHVVTLDGSRDVLTLASPFSFTFNHVSNLVEMGDSLVLDIFEVFRTGQPFTGGSFDIWLNKTRRDTEINFEAMRFTIPLGNSTSTKVEVRGILGRNVTDPCDGDDCGLIRLPRINPQFQGREYCFIYGMQTKFKSEEFASQGVVKVDLCKGEVHDVATHVPGQYPHELVFVPRPNSTDEDDGVLVGHVLDGPGNQSFIQVVDAHTLQRVANFKLTLRLGEMIHGNWFS